MTGRPSPYAEHGQQPRGELPSRRIVLKSAGLLGFGAVAASTLAACGASSAGSSPTGGSKPTGTATMAIFGTTGPCLLPNFTGNGTARAVTQCFGSSLFVYDQKLNLTPALCASYQLASDRKTYTFHLRKGVKWSDGKPFVAHDVEAAILAMSDPVTVTNWISYVQEIAGVTDRKAGKGTALPGVKVVNDSTLQVTLEHPSADFLDLFGTQFQPLPSHVTDSTPISKLTKNAFALAPSVGIGPFYMTGVAASGNMNMTRNPHYWGGPSRLQQLIVEPMTTDNGVTQMLSGALDVIPGETVSELDPGSMATLQANKAVTVTTYPNNTTQTLYMNFKTRFADVRVRRAVIYALDRAGMVKTVLDGQAKVVDSVYPTFSPYYDASAVVKYAQNVPMAKQLLAQSGWDSAKPVEFLVPTGDTVVQQASVIIQQELAAIGINAKITQADNSTAVSRTLAHQFDLALVQNVGLNNLDVSRRFATDSYNGGVNSGGYSNPKLDALMAEALQQPTMATQLPLTNQIQKIISEDVPTVMLWYRNSIAATYTAALGGVIPERGGAWLQSNEWYMK
jgi:peptide/nickel transport system substrate-binding protein